MPDDWGRLLGNAARAPRLWAGTDPNIMNRLYIGAEDKKALILAKLDEDFPDGSLLLDPTGELAPLAADRSPVQDTCYLDLSDRAHPPGLNVLDGIPQEDRHRVAEIIVAFFELAFPEGPTTITKARSSYLLLNCLRLLMDAPRPNFLAIPKLLSDEAYRTACKRHCGDPVVLSFWNDDFPSWDDDAILPLRSKIGSLLTAPAIRNILGQPHTTFSLERRGRDIVNLDRRKLGDRTAFMLGSLFIARAAGPIIINDFGFFAASYFASLLQEERFTLACDFLPKEPELRNAILAIDEKVVFATTHADATELAFYLGAENPTALMAPSLDPWEARTRDGVIAVPDVPPLGLLRANKRRSRACFTNLKASVEEAIREYLEA